jgi:two-component system response regulator YesN
MGLCFGFDRESSSQLNQLPYERQLLQSFVVLNTVRDDLEHSGYGCFPRKDERCNCMMGIFSPGEDIDAILHQAIERTAAKTGYRLRVGMGRICRNAEELMATYEDSLRAFDLYYFEQKEMLRWDGALHQPVVDNEDFDEAVTQVFHSIVAKSGDVEAKVDRVLDIVADLHYNNRMATYNRVMVFTGDLCQMLYSNRLLTGSFAERQDALQQVLARCGTFEELRSRLQNYYRELLPDVYSTASRKGTAEIYRVKQYIQEHYHEDLSLKTLAEVACVSPHYFSAYFKAETGQNYKAYLTGVRMEQALHLVLDTDLKTYEIAEKVGYNNVRRFADSFRSVYHMSPADYRRLHKTQTGSLEK